MTRLKTIQKYVTDPQKKFTIFTILGVSITILISLSALFYYRNVMSTQNSLFQLYDTLGHQLRLIHEVGMLGGHFNNDLNPEMQQKLQSRYQTALSDLIVESRELENWMAGSDSSSLKQLETLIAEKNLKQRMSEFISHARKLSEAHDESSVRTKENIQYLSYNAQVGLSDLIASLVQHISQERKQAFNGLNRVGLLLIAFCLFEVMLVWLLVFKPLYSTILRQHEELADAILESEAANRSKTDFLANVSHEIRTPMTAILGYAELLSKNDHIDQKTIHNSVNIINENASLLLALINDILDVSKIESGKFEIANKKTDLSQTLSEIYSLINVKARDKGLRLIFKNQGPIPQTIETDPMRLKQILFNIVGNAIKFTDSGSVALTVSTEDDSGIGKLHFTVEDSGCGIPIEKIDKIFTPFEQADTSVSREHSGSGLGLVLSQRLAQLMGGNVEILDTKINQGTTIDVAIAIGPTKDLTFTNQLATHLTEKFSGADQQDHKLSQKRILVVDDAIENAKLFEIYLASAGADVVTAGGGSEAIDQVQSKNFDVILLDLQMPGLDGYQVLKKLRKLHFEGPILALTAHAMEEEKRKTKQAGFDGHLTKPIQSDVLIEKVAQF